MPSSRGARSGQAAAKTAHPGVLGYDRGAPPRREAAAGVTGVSESTSTMELPTRASERGSCGVLAQKTAALLACLLLPAWAWAAPADGTGDATANAVESATPAPGKPEPAVLRSILVGSKRGKVKVFAHIIDLDTGAEVLALDADVAAYPASVAKLFSTAAAVQTLQPDEKLKTRVLVGGRNGERAATLALVGGGDPSLSARDLANLADAVAKAGIRRVDTLIIDHTLFDDALPLGFGEKQTDANYRAPIDALMVEGGAVAFAVHPGAKPGDPVTVEVSPSSPAVQVVNQAATVAGRKMALSMFTRPAGKFTEIVVQGTVGAQRGVVGAGRKRVADAGFFAGELFRRQLDDRAISVGATSYKAAGEGLHELAVHESEAADALIRHCNKTSHNQYAETLFKLVGARRQGAPATAAKANAGVRAALAGIGVDFDKLTLGNGSGLYHADRFPPRQVTNLLRGMDRGPNGARFRDTLAIAGVDGTLRGRLRGTATRGKVFAKTGTLDDVTGLAGYALGASGRYAFAMFFNDVAGSANAWRRVHDRVLEALMEPDSARKPAPSAAVAGPGAARPAAKATAGSRRPAKRPAATHSAAKSGRTRRR